MHYMVHVVLANEYTLFALNFHPNNVENQNTVTVGAVLNIYLSITEHTPNSRKCTCNILGTFLCCLITKHVILLTICLQSTINTGARHNHTCLYKVQYTISGKGMQAMLKINIE